MATFKKLVVHKLTTDFRAATVIETHPMSELEAALGPRNVLVEWQYWAINASDVNYTAGRYDPTHKPPMDCGFEAVGVVSRVGSSVKRYKKGDAVATMSYGSFSEFQVLPEQALIPIPAANPKYLPLLVGGITSYLSLKHFGQLRPGETVLITAAAGGVGQIAVQLAKAAGCHVIGTCSSQEKVDFLRSIGCDRPINYRKEKLGAVLRAEYPKGVNVVVENVGGDTLKDCIRALSLRSRLIIIGAVSHYQAEGGTSAFGTDSVLTGVLLNRSISASGFFLPHYTKEYAGAIADMVKMTEKGTLHAQYDTADFEGINDIARAVDYLHSGSNVGKVVVPKKRSLLSKL